MFGAFLILGKRKPRRSGAVDESGLGPLLGEEEPRDWVAVRVGAHWAD